ncbi:disease resistance RPP13-like protein 4 [Rosa rugosa]|uniref:disease resistance RPP13-like protein 4 n=1 Tax=Rosa rugosa TaxID=74645 RepID=UPI002B400502|nr:disease resistance RPP13-like protein 4 [Rosa rugosa]
MSTSSSKDAEKCIPKLLGRLSEARTAANTDDPAVLNSFQRIQEELEIMKNMLLLPRAKQWEQTLSDQFNALERRLDKFILGSQDGESMSSVAINRVLDPIFENVENIKLAIPLVESMPSFQHVPESWTRSSQSHQAAQKKSQVWSQLDVEYGLYESAAMSSIKLSYERLESIELKMCCLSLSIFPESSVIKKRPLIYFWIGQGFVTSTQDETAEEVGEEVFRKLMTCNLIQPHLNASSTFVNNCTIHPWIHRMLMFLAHEAELFDFSSRLPLKETMKNSMGVCLTFDKPVPELPPADFDNVIPTVFNASAQYLILKPEWLIRLKTLTVLQLGRWQNSTSHHIEVDDEAFLDGLGALKHLKYFSLRGMSTIARLPSALLKLINLEILDLRACHNLEKLPSDISSLRKLTHLDVSECYLLDIMPKGIDKLSCLEVLEGYVIGGPKRTPCRVGDLSKLKKLKRLSIHMGNEAEVKDGELEELEKIESLRRLKVSWGVVAPKLRKKVSQQSLKLSFPPDLEKLELQGIPLGQVPEWLKPSKLKKLKKLYIRGGGLDSLNHKETEDWKVEVLRLKYLKKLEIGFQQLQQEFPHLQYLEKIDCHLSQGDTYDKDIVWSKVEGDISDRYINATNKS